MRDPDSPLGRVGTLTIGEAASHVGMTPRAVRYYEGLGLVRVPLRSSHHYRLYDEKALADLRFIARCRAIGLSAAETQALRDIPTIESSSSARASTLGEQLRLTEVRIRELLSVRRELRRLLSWHTATADLSRSSTPIPLPGKEDDVAPRRARRS